MGCTFVRRQTTVPFAWLVFLQMQLVWGCFASVGFGQELSPPLLQPSLNVPSLNVPDDLELDLLLHEPVVANPLYLNFDERGRLWIVQYRQYPWPAGLKLISRDNVWRNVYDPPFAPPPPHAAGSPFRGKDIITIHEDTDGDGNFDHHTTFLEGLNLATAALKGRGGVFVMNPPYLLFYADQDQDDRPDSLHPKILLSGFGIEDSHSIANCLRWGPDGWIYATEGSTVSAAVVRHGDNGKPIANEPPIQSMGQNVWRYHPELHKYEIFAEGGGNAFGIEFDSQGRVFSGHNGGDTRGFHYIPGGYYLKNFGKHGSLSNPFAFAYYGAMKHHAVERFTHTFEIYEADSLPGRYQGKVFSISPNLHYVMSSDISADGSSRMTRDIGKVVTPGTVERDDWFTPVDIQTGPDGSLYLADWYAAQTNHYRAHEGQTNPDLGRVYRLRGAKGVAVPRLNLGQCSSDELVRDYLGHPNRWYRETALRLLGDRKDRTVIAQLRELSLAPTNPHALDALWGLNLSGGLDAALVPRLLSHPDPMIRLWTVRLIAEQPSVDPATGEQFARLAAAETNVEVRLQLACSCRRLNTQAALSILQNLLARAPDAQDVFIPNAIWWAIESHAGDRAAIMQWLSSSENWQSTMSASSNLVENLMRRYAMLGTQDDLTACAQLLQLAPDPQQTKRLVSGFSKAFEGRILPQLPTELVEALSRVQGRFAVVLGIRRGDSAAVADALAKLNDSSVPEEDRLEFIRALGEVQADQRSCVAALQRLLQSLPAERIATACLVALQRYDDEAIGAVIVECFGQMPPPTQETAQSVLASRATWSLQLLHAIERGSIRRENLTQDTIERLRWHRDERLQAALAHQFPRVEESAEQMDQRIELAEKIALAGNGNPLEGQKLFHESATCGKCHRIFDRGGDIGPDLTSYNRSHLRLMLLAIVNPSAEIREGYENMTIMTVDGRVVTGFRIDENEHVLVLRTADGQTHSIDKLSIDEQKQNKLSLMPTGLLDGLNDTQLRDLCAFLTSTTPPN